MKKTQAASKPERVESQPADVPDDGMIKGYFEQMRNWGAKINAQIQDIQEQSKTSYKDVKTWLDNPQNFSKEEWEELQKRKENTEEALYAFLGNDYKAKKQRSEASKIERKRKKKTLGARKRNWISMR